MTIIGKHMKFNDHQKPSELSECGLLPYHAKALSVQKRLRDEYPDEHHANCDVWAIWQMKMGPKMTGDRP